MGVSRREIEARIAQLRNELGESNEPLSPEITSPPSMMTRPQIQARIEQLKNEIQAEEPKEGFMHRAGQLGRAIASAAGSESDIGPPGSPMLNAIHPSDYDGIYAKSTTPMAEELPRVLGLGKKYEPAEDDTIGKIINFGGKSLYPSSLLPLPYGGYGVLGNAVGKGTKAVSKALAKELGIVGAQAAAIKGTPRLTQEGTLPGFIEDIGKGALVGSVSSIKKQPKLPKLNRNEKAVHNYLSEIVGEENIPGILERLRKSKETPFLTGYEPVTSELAGNPGFAQLQRALEGVAGSGLAEKEAVGARKIAEALRGSKLSDDDMSSVQQYFIDKLGGLEEGVHSNTMALNPKLNETEAGSSIQNAIHNELTERKAERGRITSPLYEEVMKMEDEINPSNTLNFLNSQIVRGDLENDANWVRKMIERPTKSDSEKKKAVESLSKSMRAQGYSDKAIQTVENEAPILNSTVPELSATRQAINSRIQSYKKEGKDNQARFLREIRNHIDTDLENIPLQREANQQYRELSIPVSKITKNKALNSVSKRLNDQFLMSESRVPGIFINNTAGSIDDSRTLLRELQNKPGALDDIRSYLNNLASTEIINSNTGLVDIKKLDAFKKKYPGAKIIYPELYNTKLNDIKSSQLMVDRFLKNTESVSNTIYKDALGNYTGKDSSKVIKGIFKGDSSENMSNLLHEFNGDETLQKALQNETIDYFEKYITNAGSVGEHNKISYAKTQKFLKEHEGALEQVLTPHQLTVVEEIGEITKMKNYSATEGMAKNSHTHANIRNALDFSKNTGYSMTAIKAALTKIGIGIPGAKEFFKDIREIQLQKNEKILSRALREPDYADYLLSTPLNSKRDFLDFIDKSKIYSRSRYVPPELRELIQRDEEE